jgi:hypothetical protein
MRDKSFLAEIRPKSRSKYLNKLFLSKNTVSDCLNGSPTDIHMYIPIPNENNPEPNIQIWIRNGAGKVLIRFKNPVELATTLRKLANLVTSDMCLDAYQHAEDMSQYV